MGTSILYPYQSNGDLMMKKMLLMIPIASVLLGGCTLPSFLSKTVGTVTQTAEDKVAQQEMMKNCKFDKDACLYMASAVTTMSRPVIMKSSSDIKGYGKQESQTIMDGKDNMQMIGYKNGKEDSNMILLGGETYNKDYEKNVWIWYKASAGEEDTSLIDPKKIADDFKEKFDVETNEDEYVMNKLGEETCGEPAPKLTCFKYESYMSKTPADKTIVWFDTKNHLTRRMDSTYSGTTSTITYYYDNVPAIVKPSPVEEFSMPTLPDGASGMEPSQADIEKMMKQYSQQTPAEEAEGESE